MTAVESLPLTKLGAVADEAGEEHGPLHVLRSLNILDRRSRAITLLRRASRHPGQRAYAERITELVETLEPESAVAAFDSPAGGWDLPSQPYPLETLASAPDWLTRTTRLWRHLAGVPLGVDATIAVPPGAAQPYPLPHCNLMLQPAGPMVVHLLPDGGFRIVWEDGLAATLPPARAMGEVDPVVPGRLTTAARWLGLPVEPGSPDVAAAFADFEAADDGGRRSVLVGQQRALELLTDLWPGFVAGMAPWLSGWFPLIPREGTRSHSSPWLPGILLTSATHPQSAADLLCHELAHVRLFTLLERDPLLHNSLVTGFPSPWRDDTRPLLGLLLGVHAFLDVCQFHRLVVQHRPESEMVGISEQIYAHQAGNVRRAWQTLGAVADPTPLGARLLQSLEPRVVAL